MVSIQFYLFILQAVTLRVRRPSNTYRAAFNAFLKLHIFIFATFILILVAVVGGGGLLINSDSGS